MSLKDDDQSAAKVAVAPRITLADIEAQVEQRLTLNGSQLASLHPVSHHAAEALKALTIAVVVLKNGYTFIGTSAPASAKNYDRELGERFAYENALRQIWPMLGFCLRQSQRQLSEAQAFEALQVAAKMETAK